MKKAVVFDIQKFSVHDGPGIRTIVFFKGCPLHCQWCANPESQRFEPDLLFFPSKCIGCGNCAFVCQKNCIVRHENRLDFDRENCNSCLKCTTVCHAKARVRSGREMTLEEMIAEVDKDLVFYNMSGGGITFSGGEAMCFPEIIADIAKYYKEKKISTAVETCGYVPWENFEKVLPYMDVLLFDLKLIDNGLHETYIGGANELILDNLKRACKLVDTNIRIPIIPTINDTDEAIEKIGAFLTTMKEHIALVNLLPYHDFGIGKYAALGRSYLLKDIKAPSDCHMKEIKKQLERYDLNVKIGG